MTTGQGSRHRWWAIGGALSVLILVVTGTSLYIRGVDEPPDHRPTTSAQPSPPERAFEQPQAVRLTVPETVDLAPRSFSVVAGRSYLLSFEVETVKPAGSPGSAMYFGVSLACTGPEEQVDRSITGTQNLLEAEPVTLHHQFLLTAVEDGERNCRLKIDSSREGAAATGTMVDVRSTWRMDPVGTRGRSVPADERLPVVVDAGSRREVVEVRAPMPGDPEHTMELLGTLHVTSCTITNGSREGGKALCREDMVDERGSSVDVVARGEILTAAGEVCAGLDVFSEEAHVDKRTHHQMLSLRSAEQIPTGTRCGSIVRVVLSVDNEGPAPLLVHGLSSTLILLEVG